MLYIENVDASTFRMFGSNSAVPADVYPKNYEARATYSFNEAEPRITIAHKDTGVKIVTQKLFSDISIGSATFLTALSAVTAFNALMASAVGGSGFGAEYVIPAVEITGAQDTFTIPALINTDKFIMAINGQFANTLADGITSVTNGVADSEIIFDAVVPLGNVVVILYTPQ